MVPAERQCETRDFGAGWKCNDGECIPKSWVCDKNYQCQNDDSDEEEGCSLFPGTYDKTAAFKLGLSSTELVAVLKVHICMLFQGRAAKAGVLKNMLNVMGLEKISPALKLTNSK